MLSSFSLGRFAFFSAVLAIAAVTTAHVLYYFPRTVDDMFIFLRYAENLATGNGLVFNTGERVEGFSSPLWVALLALGEWIGFSGIAVTKALALVSLLALMVGLFRFGRERLDLSAAAALLPPAFLALNSYTISWALWGLETPAYLALMVWSAVLMGRYLDGPLLKDSAWGRGIAFWLVASAFSLSRPEAPLFLGLIGLGSVLEPWRLGAIWIRLKRAVLPSLGTVVVFASYLVFRRLYFGLWLPHTYYAKQGSDFDSAAWEVLWAQGASEPEIYFVAAGAVLLLWAARRSLVPLLVTLGTLYFVASVLLDWMPNLRHFLPIWLFVSLAWAFGIDRFGRWTVNQSAHLLRRVVAGALAMAAFCVFASAAVTVARIDARYSFMDFHTHGHEEDWIRPKTMAVWDDTLLCLKRERPPHVEEMGPYHMGMITQLFRLLEADARPLEESWYVGRDIGRVGYLSPVRVFDTDGLFTPQVVQDPDWRERNRVSSTLINTALDRPVVMTELLGWWRVAAQMDRWVRGHFEPQTRRGWTHLVSKDSVRPSAVQILSRYDYALSRMPQAYYMMTLYGEAVGASLERRTEIRTRELLDNLSPQASEVPPDLVAAGVSFDREGNTGNAGVELLGCVATPDEVRRGRSLVLVCYLRALGPVHRDYRMFVHIEGEEARYRFGADHHPIANQVPTSEWQPDQVWRDAMRVNIPGNAPPGPARIFLGLYEGDHRAVVEPFEASDKTNRVVGPRIVIAE